MTGLVEDREAGQKTPLCVDARLRGSEATGVATYAEAVAEALASRGRAPLRLDDAARGRFGARVGPVEWIGRRVAAMRGRAVPLTLAGGSLYARDVYRLAQARFARTGELLRLTAPGRGVMHWTYPIPARIEGWTNVYTIHDIIPITHPELSPIDPESLRARLRAIADSAEGLMTVSAESRRAITDELGLAETAVVDTGSAIVAMDRGGEPLPKGLIENEYFLFCGMIEPRKNLPRIVAGWRSSGTARPLVIAGPGGVGEVDMRGVVEVGYLSRPRLLDLIAGARALVFPTLEEGFGLPIVEAMALGTAVITANRGALRGTAGGAALLVDPTETAAIANGIAQIDESDTLRAGLVAKGRERAAIFTLPAFGSRLLAAYAEFSGDSALRS